MEAAMSPVERPVPPHVWLAIERLARRRSAELFGLAEGLAAELTAAAAAG